MWSVYACGPQQSQAVHVSARQSQYERRRGARRSEAEGTLNASMCEQVEATLWGHALCLHRMAHRRPCWTSQSVETDACGSASWGRNAHHCIIDVTLCTSPEDSKRSKRTFTVHIGRRVAVAVEAAWSKTGRDVQSEQYSKHLDWWACRHAHRYGGRAGCVVPLTGAYAWPTSKSVVLATCEVHFVHAMHEASTWTGGLAALPLGTPCPSARTLRDCGGRVWMWCVWTPGGRAVRAACADAKGCAVRMHSGVFHLHGAMPNGTPCQMVRHAKWYVCVGRWVCDVADPQRRCPRG